MARSHIHAVAFLKCGVFGAWLSRAELYIWCSVWLYRRQGRMHKAKRNPWQRMTLGAQWERKSAVCFLCGDIFSFPSSLFTYNETVECRLQSLGRHPLHAGIHGCVGLPFWDSQFWGVAENGDCIPYPSYYTLKWNWTLASRHVECCLPQQFPLLGFDGSSLWGFGFGSALVLIFLWVFGSGGRLMATVELWLLQMRL